MTQKKTKLTIPDLVIKKKNGERLAMVAIGDYLSAKWAEKAGIDIIGVGDSLAMTLYGQENTLQVSVDQMIAHAQAVHRGAPNTFKLVSMPYGSYVNKDLAVKNAHQMMELSGADALKLQGGSEISDIIEAIAKEGIPIMSHVGLLPHYVNKYGGFKTQGRTAESAKEIIKNAISIEKAGAVGLEIEAVPHEVGKMVDESISIFTFSIGAGSAGTCQLLNGYDLIGAFDSFQPKFAKRYANMSEVAVNAFSEFSKEVKEKIFPDRNHFYEMKAGEIQKLLKMRDANE